MGEVDIDPAQGEEYTLKGEQPVADVDGPAVKSFYFYIEGSAFSGHVQATTYEDAVKILKCVHLGQKSIDADGNIAGANYLMDKKPVDKVIGEAMVNGQ